MERTNEGVRAILNEYRQAQRDLREQITDIMWHMRGGVTREEAWTLSYVERADMHRMIERRMEMVEKTGLALL